MRHIAAVLLATAAVLGGCGDHSRVAERADVGPKPVLGQPVKSVLPTVHIAPAAPWPPGTQPVAAQGLQVQALATGLAHPRWLQVLPNGDVLVAESNAPTPHDDKPFDIKTWVQKKVMARAGAGVPSADRITLLRDADGDGIAEQRTVLVEGVRSPFGMALVGDTLYVAATDAVLAWRYAPGQTRITEPARRVAELPAGRLNHHWTKNLVAAPDGQHLYITVGSNSNVAENGLPAEEGRATIWELDLLNGRMRLFASGLRNPNGMAWMAGANGATTLWTVVNERDEIGSDLVPDYLTSVRDGGFYGWPWSWYGQHVDERAQPPNPERVAAALVPDYALGSHVAPLGLASADGNRLPGFAAPGVFIGEHGSWNRRPLNGYKVVYLPFAEGRPQGLPVDVLTGFVDAEGQARGRPVGVAIDRRGALLVADDVGNTVWRVSPR